MDWLASTAGAAQRSARAVAGRALGHHARRQLRAGRAIRWRSSSARDRGAISVYAQGDDYHDVIKSRLKALARWLIANAGGDVKVFVDTAAVMEKPLAAAAGLGWQGKHTNLVSRELRLVAVPRRDLHHARAAARRARDRPLRHAAAPASTSARPRRFPAPYRLDARRCISYLTIEHKGPIPRELRAAMGNRIYGCDDCLAVCPWNKFAQAGPRGEARGARRAARAAARRARAARRCGVPRAVRQDRRSSAPGATASCATC